MRCKELTLALISAYLVAVAINFEGFFWGDVPEDRIQILATMCYAVVSVCYLLYTRKQQSFVVFSVCAGGGLALAGGLAALARSYCDVFAIPGALLATVFVTPLYGIRVIFHDWDTLYSALAIIGGIWLAVSLTFFRDNRRENDEREEL